MTGNNDLRILLKADLNIGSSVKSINDSIKALENHPSLKSIKVKLDLDTSTLKQFISSVNNMKKMVSEQQNKVIWENIEIIKKLDGTTQQIRQWKLASNPKEVLEQTKTINDAAKAMQNETTAAYKLSDSVEKLNKAEIDHLTTLKNKDNVIKGYKVVSSQGYTTTTNRLESDGQTLIGSTSTTNYKKQREDQVKAQKYYDDLETKLIGDFNKKVDSLEKQRYIATQKNTQRDIDFRQSVALQQQKINDIQRRFGADTNVKTSLDSLSSQLSNVSPVGNYKNALKDIDIQLKSIIANAKTATSHTLGFGQALQQAFIKFPVWLISGTIFVNATRFFTQGIAYVNELNSALTQISIVTGKSQQEVAKLGMEYNNLAKEMGVTTKQIAEASVEFYRQGLSQSDVMERVKTATEFAKISNLDFTDSAKILTATTNSMGVSVERASDVFAYLGDATATGADEIGRAFQKVGGSAGALNLNFEKVSSWIAVVSSRTREGAETIGQSIKSILARIQNMREKGFDETDGTKVNDVAKALSSVGIELMDQNGNFSDFGKTMDLLGEKWSSLDSRTKAYISTTVAGSYQQSRFLNLMEGYSDTIPLYEKALQAAGTTTQKFGLYQQGTQAAIDRLKASMEGLWQNSFSSSGLQTAIGTMNVFITLLDKIVSTVGFIPTVFGLAGAGAIMLSSNFRASVASGTLLTSTLTGLTISAGALSTALRTILASTGVGLGFVALGFVIEKLIGQFSDLQTKSENLSETHKNNTKEIDNNIESLQKLASEYQNLKSKTDKTTADNERLHKIEKDLVEMYGVSITGINAQGQAYADNTEAINKRIEALIKQKKTEDDILRSKVIGKNDSDRDSIGDQISKLDSYQQKVKEYQEAIDNINNALINGGSVKLLNGQTSDDKDYLGRLLKGYNSDLAYFKEQLMKTSGEVQKSTQDIVTVVNNEFENTLSNSGKKVSDKYRVYVNEIINALSVSNVPIQEQFNVIKKMANDSSFDDLITKYEKLKTELAKSPSKEAENQLKEVSNQILKSFGDITSTLPNLTESGRKGLNEFSEGFLSFSNTVSTTANPVVNLRENVSKLTEDLQDLKKAQDELKDNNKISSDTFQKLLKDYPELIAYMNDEQTLTTKINELYKSKQSEVEKAYQLDFQKLYEANSAKLDVNVDYFNSVIKGNEDTWNIVKTAYGTDAENFKTVADAKKTTDDLLRKYLGDSWSSFYGSQENALEAFIVGQEDALRWLSPDQQEEAKARIASARAQLEAVKAIKKPMSLNLKNIDLDGLDKKPKKEKDDTQASLHTLTDFTNEAINNIQNAVHESELAIKSLEKQLQTATNAKDYAKSLELINSLIDAQKTKITNLDTANTKLKGSADDIRSTYSDLADKFSQDGVGFDKWFNFDNSASTDYISLIQSIDKELQNVEGDGKNLTDDQKVQIKKLEDQKSLYEKIFGQIQNLKKAYQGNIEDITTVNDAIEDLSQKLLDTQFNHSKDWIAQQKELGQLSLEDELSAWTRVKERYDENSSYRIEAEKEVYRVTSELRKKEIQDTLDAVKAYEKLISASNTRLSMLEQRDYETFDSTKYNAYNNEIANQITLLQKKQQAEEASEAAIRKQMSEVGITKDRWQELNQQLEQSVNNQLDIQSALKSTNDKLIDQREAVADEFLDLYKQYLEQKKQYDLDALDIQIESYDKDAEAFKESQEAKIRAIDEEIDKLDEVYNARIKLIDDQADEDEYQTNLSDKQKEQQDLQNKINELALSDDIADKARRAELQQQLADKTKDINKLMSDHEKDLRKKSLQDELEAKKDELEATKETEEKKSDEQDKYYEEQKKKIEDLKELVEKNYENQLNDEKTFYQLKQQIMSGDFTQSSKLVSDFTAFYKSNMNQIGTSISTNMIDKLTTLSSKMTSTSSLFSSQFTSMSSTINTTVIGAIDGLIKKLQDLNNTSFDKLNSNLSGVGSNSNNNSNNSDYTKKEFSLSASAGSYAQEMRIAYNSAHGTNYSKDDFRDPKNNKIVYSIPYELVGKASSSNNNSNTTTSQPTTNPTPTTSNNQAAYLDGLIQNGTDGQKSWANQYKYLNDLVKTGTDGQKAWAEAEMLANGMEKFHTGGEIGTDTSTGGWLHKLLNLGQGEIPIIAKEGELVLKNPVSAISNLLSSIKMPDYSNFQPKLAKSGGDTNYNLQVSFPNFSGSKNDANYVVSKIENLLKNKGK